MKPNNSNERYLVITILAVVVLLTLVITTSSLHSTTDITGTPEAYSFLSTDYVKSVIKHQADAHNVSSNLMIAVSGCESGWHWNAIGDRGHSIGIFQISDYGLGPEFYQRFHSRFNVWESATFAAEMFAARRQTAWSCWWMINGWYPPWWHGVHGG